jgi:hypothetical protein
VEGPNLFFWSNVSIFFLSKDITERLAIVGDSTTPVSLKISKHNPPVEKLSLLKLQKIGYE